MSKPWRDNSFASTRWATWSRTGQQPLGAIEAPIERGRVPTCSPCFCDYYWTKESSSVKRQEQKIFVTRKQSAKDTADTRVAAAEQKREEAKNFCAFQPWLGSVKRTNYAQLEGGNLLVWCMYLPLFLRRIDLSNAKQK